jgi:hypothetical protein
MLLLLGMTVAITWIDYRNGTRSKALDFILFFLTGMSGLVLAFLWFLTDHNATVWNANLLWAFPLNLVLCFLLLFPLLTARQLRTCLKTLLVLLGAAALIWIFRLQVFSPVLFPVWAALLLRYTYLITYFRPLP